MNLDHYRRQLLELEQELAVRLREDVETAGNAREEQPTDLAHANQLKDDYFALAEADSAILVAVRAALRRIEDRTYGRCAVDGAPIDEKRLEAVPWTTYCLEHQTALEWRAGTRTPSL